MTTAIHVVSLVLGVVGVCHGALAVEAPVAPPAQIDVQLAARLLAQARFEFPVAAEVLWKNSDGLPNPTEARFASEVSGFLEKHPVTAPDAAKPGLWEIGETASRQLKCLAYLAKGSEEARQDVARLCVVQAMQVQWAFPVRAGSRAKVDDTFCAAAAGLTMTGELLYRGAGQDPTLREVAAQWMRTGTGQMAGNPLPGDPTWRAASAMIERAAVPPDLRDLHGTDEGFFLQIDLTRPDMREVARRVAAKDWEGAKRDYVTALAQRFSRRQGWPDMSLSKSANVAEADDICRNVFILQAHMYRRYDFGEHVDWAKAVDNDVEARVWMNAHPWMGTLLRAHEATGDDKYVLHLCRLFQSWYAESPPTFVQSRAQWRTLEAGNRTGQKWPEVLLTLAEHPTFQRDALFPMARSMLDHGKYLSMYAAPGGNWLQVESSGLACVALLFPEFRLSPLFYETAASRLAWINARSFLPDGFQSECTAYYHYFPLIGIAGAARLATFLDRPMPASLRRQVEAASETMQHVAYPDGTLPMLSDGEPRRTSVRAILGWGADSFGREDLRWLATAGRTGTVPKETSHDFTHAGYCVMRDTWGPDAQMLLFDAGYLGAGHRHEDKLNFVFYAGRRELIGDPGIYLYKRDAFEPYWRGSWSHNTILVDGLSQHRELGPAEAMPDPDRRFVRGDDFDFAAGWYRRAYSPRTSMGADKADLAKAIRDVQHQRCIFYLKGRYAAVCDRVLGEGEHAIDVLFHPAPVPSGDPGKGAVRPVTLDVRADGAVVTTESEYANVALVPARMEGVEVRNIVGQKEPVRGWYALNGIMPSHDIVYRARARLPWQFETVVMPLPHSCRSCLPPLLKTFLRGILDFDGPIA